MQAPKLATIPIFWLTLLISIFGAELSRIMAIAEVHSPAPNLLQDWGLGCELQPSANPPTPPAKLTNVPIFLERFRQLLLSTGQKVAKKQLA